MPRPVVLRRRRPFARLRARAVSRVLGWVLAAAVVAPAPAALAAANKGKKAPAARTKGKTSAKGKPRVMQERQVAAFKGGLPNVQALGALVIDEQGHELFSRNPDRERPIASVSKLAAVLVVMDHGLELEGLTTITKTDTEVARGGAHSRLLEGLTVSNRDLLHAALLGSDNRAIPALGRAVKLAPAQLAAAMTAKAKELGLVHTRFHDPTGLSPENVSTPRDTIVMLRAVMKQPVLAGITHRLTYEAHPVGRPPIVYNNTYKPAIRRGVEVLAGKTGYNDEARYCLVIATHIAGQTYFMSFLSNEGKLTRFGDVARVADWILLHKAKGPSSEAVASAAPAKEPAAPAPATSESTTQPATTASQANGILTGPADAKAPTPPLNGPSPAPPAPATTAAPAPPGGATSGSWTLSQPVSAAATTAPSATSGTQPPAFSAAPAPSHATP